MGMTAERKQITDAISIYVGPTCGGEAYLDIYNSDLCDSVVATLDTSQLNELAAFLRAQAKAMEED